MSEFITLSLVKTEMLLLVFGIFMLASTYLFAKWRKRTTAESFFVGERKVSWLLGGSSITASWIWAPALFISTLFAYQFGLAGLFWFVFPNFIALALYAFFAPKIRDKMPYGYTLPQYIREKLGSEGVHRIYLFPFFFYQLMAITVQLFAGGNLLALLLGIPVVEAVAILTIAILAAIPLTYSMMSGLAASILTDFIQLLLIVVSLIIIIPWIVAKTGFEAIVNNLSGLSGSANIFDPGIAFSLGIVTAIGLLSGALSDQQFWQRSFAIKRQHLRGAFIFGAVVFSIVPIALGLLGFIGADPNWGINITAIATKNPKIVKTVIEVLPPVNRL